MVKFLLSLVEAVQLYRMWCLLGGILIISIFTFEANSFNFGTLGRRNHCDRPPIRSVRMAAEGVESCAREAALSAGKIMIEGRDKLSLEDVISKQGSRDILTEYDTACQNKIYEVIKSTFPGHAFLGEEDVAPEQ